MFLDSATQFWSEWGLRISVLVSLAAYALLGLLSGTRRRSASGGSTWILQWALGAILWTLYQLAEIAAASAIGNLSLRGAGAGVDASSGEEEELQQLVAFWAPFLLLHLGGPDNLTAYALEDNMLSLRKTVEMALQIAGAMYAVWNYIYRANNSSRLLLAASAMVFVEGAARYVERAYALRRANLDNMQEQEQDESGEKPPAAAAVSSLTSAGGACSSTRSRSSCSSSAAAAAAAVESTISRYEGGRRALDDGEALLLAQDLFHVWRRFLVDSSVDRRSPWQRASEKLLSLPWDKTCKVVEMELSLMYEVLYTKAAVAHTWAGYLIRFTSPVCAAAAASLFWLHHRDGSQRRGPPPGRRASASSFVGITYLLLGAAFAMDVAWLLRALGSTWTYAFLKKTNKVARRRPWIWSWFRHKALCAGWWRRLHRAVVCLDLDPLRLALGVDPVAYRRWSGTIGRYDLLHECTVRRHRPWCRWLAAKLGLEEQKYLSELPRGVKQLLFERVQSRIQRTTADNPSTAYDMALIRTCWGQEALRRGEKLFRGKGGKNEPPKSGREFEEDVLLWHIATCVFLSRRMVRKVASSSSSSSTHAAAIAAVSEYLMFLVARRRQMLPGLVLHSLLDETRRALNVLWREGGRGGRAKFITFLRQKKVPVPVPVPDREQQQRYGTRWAEQEGDRLVSDALAVAVALTKGSRHRQEMVPMLDLVFNVWVDKLLYASIRCSRESHAKQLSRGGELTTVLWMLVQHAGPFRIGEEMPADAKKRQENMSEEKKKKKEEEEKKKKCIPPQAPWMAPPYPYPYYPSYSYPLHPSEGDDEQPVMLKPMPPAQEKPEEARVSETPIPDDEEDPEDARDYRTTVEYITLY